MRVLQWHLLWCRDRPVVGIQRRRTLSLHACAIDLCQGGIHECSRGFVLYSEDTAMSASAAIYYSGDILTKDRVQLLVPGHCMALTSTAVMSYNYFGGIGNLLGVGSFAT